MLADFLAKLEHTIARAQSCERFVVPEKPRSVFIRRGELLEEHTVESKRRAHTVHGLDDLLTFATDPERAPRPELFLAESGVVLHLDAEDRHETVRMLLRKSERWAALSTLGGQGRAFEVPELCSFLRLQVGGDMAIEASKACRAVNFERITKANNAVTHGRESLGRSVDMAVVQAEQIPEEIVVDVPVFSTVGCGHVVRVRVAVVLDMKAERIRLAALPDQLVEGIEQALGWIHAKLAQAVTEGTLLVYGEP